MNRPAKADLFWIAGGSILLAVVLLLALRYHHEEDISARIAFKRNRIELTERMRTALASASEAEKSAVMATTDESSQSFADQARTASAQVAQRRDELAVLLQSGGSAREQDLLARFSSALEECDRIDRALLDLAVQNTNLKAFGLAFGPATEALARMDGALSRILKEFAASPIPEAKRVMLLAADARSGAWRLHALVVPHIAEESDQRMDELEAGMATEDGAVRSDLKELAVTLGTGSSDLETAVSAYATYSELKARILSLSRRNTNVRSVMISQNEKRKALAGCLDALNELEEAIRAEPLSERAPVIPR
jgi:hypothetical protein